MAARPGGVFIVVRPDPCGMVTTHTDVDRPLGGQVGSSVVGGLVAAVLGLLHLFVLGVGGWAGIGLLYVVWPIVGGIVAAVGLGGLTRERPLAGALAGTYGALIVSVLVLLTGAAGLWSPFVTSTFGVSLWPVFFTVSLVTLVTWTVFGYVGGWATDRPS